MQVRSVALATDVQVAQLTGSLVVHADHLVVTTPDQPAFYWGNFIAIPAPRAAAEAAGWIARAAAAVPPGAAHAAVAIDGGPAEVSSSALGALLDAGCAVEVLVAMTRPAGGPAPYPPAGVVVRQLGDDDWPALVSLTLSDGDDGPAMRAYLAGAARARARLVARGAVRWWGAFVEGALVASAGVVPLGGRARYQDVQTHPAHRRRGLATAVLSAIAADEGARGVEQLVLVVGDDNQPARAAYRRLGFVESDRMIHALRVAAPSPGPNPEV
ncbi:MAG: GNAT family N-acetyltransferase [Kofleriaceae bacterium]